MLSARWQQIQVRVTSSGEHATLTGAALAVLHRLTSDPAAWMTGDLEDDGSPATSTRLEPADDVWAGSPGHGVVANVLLNRYVQDLNAGPGSQ